MNDELHFDFTLYGVLMQVQRKKKGITSAEKLAQMITETTGYEIGRSSIYKIEQGKQMPSAIQFMAINKFLFGEMFPDKIVKTCGVNYD